jgi:two-component system, OmpR family, KDP operon response regulator KdpE
VSTTGIPGAPILVVEDAADIRRFVEACLRTAGYPVATAANGMDALALLRAGPVAAIVLDLGLPDIDGMDVIRAVRTMGATPIVVLSARIAETQKIEALDLGADDYLTKPFSAGELLARIRVALRHAAAGDAAAETVHRIGDLEIDVAARRVRRSGADVRLTPTEFKLLVRLARNAGRVVTHRQLLAEVWGPEYVEHTHYLRIYMGQLRAKLESDPADPRFLLTDPGVGYRLAEGFL